MDLASLLVAIGGICTGLLGSSAAIYQVRRRTQSHDFWTYVKEVKEDREEARAETQELRREARELRLRIEKLERELSELRREQFGQTG